MKNLLRLFLIAALASSHCAPTYAAAQKKPVPQRTGTPANETYADTAADDADPLSGYNHAMFEFNRVVDGVVLKPAAQIYRGVVPEEGRNAVTRALANLYSPVTFGNSVLQADAENAFATLFRFLINSTVGIGGLFDVAAEIPLKNRTTDFGQTLAVYGAGPGAYVVLPIIGPSNVRDTFGHIGDVFMQPWTYANDTGLSLAIYGTTAVDARSQNMKLLDNIYSSSVDPYATFKSAFTQKRAADVNRTRIERRKALEKTGFQ